MQLHQCLSSQQVHSSLAGACMVNYMPRAEKEAVLELMAAAGE